ncbi:MAG: PKD domain-containing protein [Bacteroidetes bacterium]|nr:PKD domain-containing protein [Bacteroidota bacterium]
MSRVLRIAFSFLALVLLGNGMVYAQAPVANFSASPSTSCAPVLVQFTDLSTNSPTSWSWNLGNGTSSILQNPSTIYNTPGTYTISLTATNASGSNTKTITGYITILPAPTAAFSSTDTSIGCGSKIVQFVNSSTLGVTGTGTYYWDFGDGTNSSATSPSHTYTTTGTYTVSLIVTNAAGCANLLSKSSYVHIVPSTTANFTATNNNSCNPPVTVAFNNTSSGGSSYQWDFGDGSSSTSASPTHTYSTAGFYTVRLISMTAAGCRDTMTKTSFVTIGSLSAGYSQSANSVCTRSNVNFTNSTAPSGATYAWSFGDGTASVSANPSHAYSSAGTYTVRLIANYNGCNDTATSTVTVSARPSNAFLGNPIAACSAPLNTAFTNSTSGASSYYWDFGDGGTSTSTNPSHSYTANGVYNVTLISTGSNGCTDTLKKNGYVTVQPISASISNTAISGCAPVSSTFLASVVSVVPISSYSWNFGDGGTGSGASVSHTYNAPGSYTVTLIVQTSTGCTDTATKTVLVGAKPTAGFTASPTTACVNSLIAFTNSSTGATNYSWIFGSGGGVASTATNPLFAYDGPGIYSVTLIASNNGCNDTLTRSNYITINGPKVDFSDSVDCANRKHVFFRDSSVGATGWVWNFGDGSPLDSNRYTTHTYSSYGSYNVTLTAWSTVTGCVVTKTRNVVLWDPAISFSESDTVLCKGGTLTLTKTCNWTNTNWYYGDGATNSGWYGTHVYNATGLYTLKVIVTDWQGCRDSLIKPNRIRVNSPTAAFSNTPMGGCGALSVSFTDQSTASSGSSITNRRWDFGDGTILNTTATSLTHVYALGGNYTVKLYITETGGCQDSVVKSSLILVNRPVAQFNSPNVLACLNIPVSFVNTSTSQTPASYTWAFGDGGTSTTTSPSHSYTSSGTYTVQLIATDSNGCRDTMTKTTYINVAAIDAVYTMNDSVGPCPPFTVNFTNSSTNAVSYNWIFGNGGSSVLTNPTATFPVSGTFYVKLIATNSNGCKDTAIHSVYVGPSPSGTMSYTPVTGCAPLSLTITTTSANTSSLTFDFDNGTTLTTTSNTITYTYTTPGVFIPKVIFQNGTCATFLQGGDTIKNTQTFGGFTANTLSGCVGTAVQFTDTSYAIPSSARTYQWSFGDGSSSVSASPSHVYSTAGTFTVRQIVGTPGGCSDTTSMAVVIHPLPVMSVANQTICGGGNAQLSISGAASFSWSPATGLSCTTCSNPIATPTTTTTYTITGTTSFGCSDTTSAMVTVNPRPTVSAGSAATMCAGAFATLTASGANSYQWTPATGLSCTNCASPTATPSNTTTYKVVGSSAAGCTDSATVTVTVYPKPVLSTAGNQFICPGGSVSLNATGASTYSWTPSSSLSCSSCANPSASPAATTTYQVVGTSTNGCKDSVSLVVNVNPTPSISVTGTKTICAGSGTSLTASGANSYSWTPATGLSCTNCANPTATPAATTTYTVSGTSGAGCSGSTTVTVTVNPLPSVYAGADTALCAGFTAALHASGASNYVWTPAATLSCNNCANPNATPVTTTTYVVTGTDGNGCSALDSMVVTVNPLPVVSAGPNLTICPGGTATLNATGAASYSWSPATGLSCTSCASPTASPSSTTTYLVTGNSAAGCVDTASMTLVVNPTPSVSISGPDSICAGGSASLTATGASTYSWTPATGLSCTNCANPTASPASTTTYTITGTSGVGCTATTSFTLTVSPLPGVYAGPDTAVCAGGSVTLSASGASSYIWTPTGSLSCSNCASPTAGPTTTTTYAVSGTSAVGCVSSDTVVVTVKPLPVISAGSNVAVCPGTSTTLTATGGQSYVWTPATGLSCTTCASPVASPSSNTTYFVTGTAANGCSDTASVNVSINPTPNVTVSGVDSICAGDNSSLTASGAASYSWTPATGLSCSNCSNPSASPAATTTYTVVGTSGVGCSDTTSFTLVVNSLPNVNAGPDVAICAGSSVGLNATGATNYSWTGGPGLSCTNCSNPTASPSDTTTYVVTGSTAFGCLNRDTITVFVKDLPTVSAGSNRAICPGGSVTLTATGASSYSWTPATGLSCTNCASPTATPASNTTYVVTGTSSNGCSDTASVSVSINPAPALSFTGSTTVCAGDSTVLTAMGAASYSWSPSTGLSCSTCANPTFRPTATTTYTLTGTTALGCSASTAITITVNPLPVVSAGADTALCLGDNVTLKASGASTYVWTPNSGLSCTICAVTGASPIVTTTYVVTGSSAAGCSNKDSLVVTVKPLPNISAGNNVGICPGGSVTLNASGGQSYQWAAASSLSCTTCSAPVATPSTTTTYAVTGTGANGCISQDSVTVTVNPLPVVSLSGNTSVCEGNTTTLTSSGAASYVWSPATGLSCTTCASPVVTPTATRTYKVVGTSGTGCSDSATITVNYHPLPVVTVDTPKSICQKDSVQLTAKGASSYLWSPAAGLSCANCAQPTASPTATTNYVVTGTDMFGCSDTASAIVTVLPLPQVDAGQDQSICQLTNVQLAATGAVSYSWSPATGLSCTNCSNPVASPTKPTTYVVTGTGANGCVNADTVAVAIYPQPPVNAGPDFTICSGQSTQLQASGAVDYSWTPASSLSCTNCPNPLATPAITTTYSVVGRDAHGCVDSDAVAITVIQRGPVTVSPGGEVCEGESVALLATGGDQYEWFPMDGLSCSTCPNPNASPKQSVTYHVSIRQGTCFADTLSTDVIIHPLPTIDAGPDLSMVLGNNVQIKTSGTDIATYKWSPVEGLSCTTCASPFASPTRDMVYVVEVASDFGCKAQDEVAIKVMCDGSQIWLPNTFTPNADGENDRFYPHAKGILVVSRFRIYDRWGELVFDRTNMPVNDKNAGWDGTFKGQPLKPDVFVWVMDANCTNGEHTQSKGDISLIR